MPPIAPSTQGSRAGLITALVLFVILFVTSTFLAMYFNTQLQAELIKHRADVDVLKPVVNASLINNPDVISILQDAKTHPPFTGIEEAIQQRNAVSKLITGNANATVEGVRNDTEKALKDVTDILGKRVPFAIKNDDLLGNLRLLARQIVVLSGEVDVASAAAADAFAMAYSEIDDRAKLLKEKDDELQKTRAERDAEKAKGDARETTIKAKVDEIDTSAKADSAKAQADTEAVRTELTKVSATLKKSVEDLRKSYTQLAKFRANPSRSLLQPAGVVTRVPGNNTVFINLGEGRQISPGLTFEVYDKSKGLPSLEGSNPENPDALPNGKASIEVVRILADTSECRIIHEATGRHIVEGDLVLNLIYNTHAKFTFCVFGDFDLSNTGQKSDGDLDVLKRLVTQWGGRAQDHVNIETDFLVLGKEPVVQPLGDNPTALDNERQTRQTKALDDYNKILTAASELHIPVLNQNRFLYFIGYYDQAKR